MSLYSRAMLPTLFIALSALCHCSAPRPFRASPPVVYPAGDTIRVGVGERFGISLPSLAGAGYAWQPADRPRSLMSYDFSYYRPSEEPLFAPASAPEKSLQDVLLFTARKPGTERLKLLLARPWETTAADSTERIIIITNH